ncbi:MAG: GNAT family N-acetyltransferase [Granulosicoccus sp.]
MTVSTNDTAVTTRVASLEEINLLLEWAGDEGWNPGLDDAQLFHASDASGFLVSTINDHIVAGISLVKHSADQSFLGLYLCKPEHRGTGIGIATWRAALDTIDNHTIGLDGVVDQQDNYRKSGFVYCFGNRRYAGTLAFNDGDVIPVAKCGTVQIANATHADINAIIDYDASIGGGNRSRFFNAWMQACSSRNTFIALEGHNVVGIVGVRRCQDGYKVGPWLADSRLIATRLLAAVSAVTKDESVMIDIPDINVTSIEIAESLSLRSMFDTARMYKGKVPDIDRHRLFGVATLELG